MGCDEAASIHDPFLPGFRSMPGGALRSLSANAAAISARACPRKDYGRRRPDNPQTMSCPECGARNRKGVSYCDSCGAPLSEALETRATQAGANQSGARQPGRLMGMMIADWTMRSALAGIVGVLGALYFASYGEWGLVVLFALISLAGWGFFVYTTANTP
jgi:zinc-ribbon domain